MQRRPISRRFLLAPMVLAISTGAGAQSLQELYYAARMYDATLLSARALAESTQYRAAQSRALRLPSASLTANATRSETDPPASLTNPTGARLGITNTGVGINARQPLFNRANAATMTQAEKSFELASAELESAEQDLVVRVAQAYFDVLAANDSLGTSQAGKKAISEQLASAKRNFEVGTATVTDTREAQARFDLATAQEIAADNDLRTKRVALDQLAGRSNVKPWPLAVPVVLPPMQPAEVEAWVGAAESEHPLVRKAQLGLAIASLETDKAKAGHLPTVDLVGSVGSSRNTGGATGTTHSAAVGVQLTLPLFAGYAIQNRVKETLSLEERSRNDLDAARRSVAQGTRVAFFGVQSGQAQVKALEAAESSSQLALEATQLGYRVGVRVNLDVLNAQTQLFQTQRDLSKARYDVLVGGLRLRLASGQLRPEDLAAVTQLLAK